MKAFGHRPTLNPFRKRLARDPVFQPDIQLRSRRGARDIPQLRFRLSTQFGGFGRRRMHLQRKPFLGIKDFDQQRKTSTFKPRRAQQFSGVMFHQPVQVPARQRPVGDNAHVARPVADLPRFTNGHAWRQRLAVKLRQLAPAPDSFLKNGIERQGVKHGSESKVTGRKRQVGCKLQPSTFSAGVTGCFSATTP